MEENKIKKIRAKKSVLDRNRAKESSKMYRQLQQRLKDLVKQHGLLAVCAASGLSEKSLKQYIGVSNPPSISKDTVENAEYILEGL